MEKVCKSDDVCLCLSRYLGQDGDTKGLAGVCGPQIDGQLGEKPPGGLSLHPACKLGAIPKPWRKLLDTNHKERDRGKTQGQYNAKKGFTSLSFPHLGLICENVGILIENVLFVCSCKRWKMVNQKKTKAWTYTFYSTKETTDSSTQSYYVLE